MPSGRPGLCRFSSGSTGPPSWTGYADRATGASVSAGATTAPPAMHARRPLRGSPGRQLQLVARRPSTRSAWADPQATKDPVDNLYKSAVDFQRVDLENQIDQFSKFRDSVGAGSDAGQRASAVIQELTVKLTGLHDPLTEQQKIAQTAQRCCRPAERRERGGPRPADGLSAVCADQPRHAHGDRPDRPHDRAGRRATQAERCRQR